MAESGCAVERMWSCNQGACAALWAVFPVGLTVLRHARNQLANNQGIDTAVSLYPQGLRCALQLVVAAMQGVLLCAGAVYCCRCWADRHSYHGLLSFNSSVQLTASVCLIALSSFLQPSKSQISPACHHVTACHVIAMLRHYFEGVWPDSGGGRLKWWWICYLAVQL